MTEQDIEYIPPKKPRRELVPVPADETAVDRKRKPAVVEGMQVLDPKRETFEERRQRLEDQGRTPYAGMVAHQEMAAMILASGGTMKQAAAKAGVSKRQVKKYYQSASFRQRVEELRQIKFQKIAGRVLKELEKRTAPGKIDRIELLDLLRVFDRMYGDPRKSGGGLNVGEINVTNNYDAIISALQFAKSGGKGGDFPGYRPEELQVSGENPPE